MYKLIGPMKKKKIIQKIMKNFTVLKKKNMNWKIQKELTAKMKKKILMIHQQYIFWEIKAKAMK